jgi:tetratricopeptide (TPR) repeat protein
LGARLENVKLNDLLKKAKDAFQRNDLKTAGLLLNEVIDQNPNCTEGYFYLANVFHVKGELGKAIKAFRKVLELIITILMPLSHFQLFIMILAGMKKLRQFLTKSILK